MKNSSIPPAMNAIMITADGPQYVEVPTPRAEPGSVIVKVELSGLCGSDLHRIRDMREGKISAEHILGHEIVGRVVELGTGVRRISLGERVVVNPIIACNQCDHCSNELTQLCSNIIGVGKNQSGGYSEYVRVPAENAYPISEAIPAPVAVLFDDIAVAVHTRNLAKGFSKKSVAVVGDGALGITVARLAKHEGATRVTIYGRTNKTDLVGDEVSNEENAFDIILEAVGGPQSESLNKAIKLAKPRAHLLVLGVYPHDFFASITARSAFYKEIKIQGVNSYGVHYGASEAREALQLMTRTPNLWEGIVSATYPLQEFPTIFPEYEHHRRERQLIKIAFMPGSEPIVRSISRQSGSMSEWSSSDRWELSDFIPTNIQVGDIAVYQNTEWTIQSVKAMGRLSIQDAQGKTAEVYRWSVKIKKQSKS